MTKHVTLEIDADTLARAEEAGIDLSALLARALRRELPLRSDAEWERAKQWYQENKEEVDSYNEFIARHGLFSDGIRKF